MFRGFNIRRVAAVALVLLGAFSVEARASIYRGNLPGRGHVGGYGVGPASAAPGMKQGAPGEAVIPGPPDGSQAMEPVSAGSGCETPHPGGGSWCVHPGLQKTRGQ